MSHTAYARASLIAARAARNGATPADAWDRAVSEVFPQSATARAKSCPKVAFLSLCETGRVRGVATGTYTHSKLNRQYTRAALALLSREPALAGDKAALWSRSCGNPNKRHNAQMDVVLALHGSGDLLP